MILKSKMEKNASLRYKNDELEVFSAYDTLTQLYI